MCKGRQHSPSLCSDLWPQNHHETWPGPLNRHCSLSIMASSDEQIQRQPTDTQQSLSLDSSGRNTSIEPGMSPPPSPQKGSSILFFLDFTFPCLIRFVLWPICLLFFLVSGFISCNDLILLFLPYTCHYSNYPSLYLPAATGARSFL